MKKGDIMYGKKESKSSDCSAGHKILAGSQGVQGINTRTDCLTADWPECI